MLGFFEHIPAKQDPGRYCQGTETASARTTPASSFQLHGCGVALQARSVLLPHHSSFLSSWRNPLNNTPGELQEDFSRSGTSRSTSELVHQVSKVVLVSERLCIYQVKGHALPPRRAVNQRWRCHRSLRELQGSRNRLAEPQTKPGWVGPPTAQDNQRDGHIAPWLDLPLTPDEGAHWELVPTMQFCTFPQQKSHQARKTHLPASITHFPSSQLLKS